MGLPGSRRQPRSFHRLGSHERHGEVGNGGALATAGGLVFYGTMEGWLKALDQKTGKELWRFKTPSGIIGNPMSYLGPDKKQYVAVYSGIGGWVGIGVAAGIGSRRSDRKTLHDALAGTSRTKHPPCPSPATAWSSPPSNCASRRDSGRPNPSPRPSSPALVT